MNLPQIVKKEISLSHFSDDLIHELYPCEQLPHFKPKGLWISVDGEEDWAWWCEVEEFRNTGKQIHYSVILEEKANVLILDSVGKIRQFNEEFKDSTYEQLKLNKDWWAVSQKYDGIIIAPYQWQLRLDSEVMWYYAWDCASGCIWNPRAIKELKIVRDGR